LMRSCCSPAMAAPVDQERQPGCRSTPLLQISIMSALLGEAKGHPQRLRGWKDHRDDLHATWQRYEPARPPRALTEGYGRSCTGSHGRRATSPNCFPRFPVLQGEMDRPCRARPVDPVLVAERGARGVRDRTGPEPAVHAGYTRPAAKGVQRAPAVTTGCEEPQVNAGMWPWAGASPGGGSEFESPHPAAASPSGLLPTKSGSPRTGLTLRSSWEPSPPDRSIAVLAGRATHMP
jgi:hypothetical protein